MVPTILGSFFQLQKAMGFEINLGIVTIPPVYGVLVDIYIYYSWDLLSGKPT